MYAGLWLGLITLSVSDLINTAEPHLPPPPPGGSQYNQIPDTTEMTGPGGPLVSHRDIRVMLSSVFPPVTSLDSNSPLYFPVHHDGHSGLLGRRLPDGSPLPPDGAGQASFQTRRGGQEPGLTVQLLLSRFSDGNQFYI